MTSEYVLCVFLLQNIDAERKNWASQAEISVVK